MNGEGNTCKVYDEEVNSLNDKCENVFRLGSVRKKWELETSPFFITQPDFTRMSKFSF